MSSEQESTEGGVLRGKQVAFSGKLASLTHPEAADFVRALGGTCVSVPSRRTDLLVLGQEGWPLKPDGELTQSLERARALEREGTGIRIIPEEEFLRKIGLEDDRGPISSVYTSAQLCRILGIPRDRLRLWIRTGLVHPVRSVHRLAYFDFREVANAKALGELVGAGIGVDQIRRSLEQLQSWIPGLEQPVSRLKRSGDRGITLRLADGRRVEPSGQLLFDFLFEDHDSEPATIPMASPVRQAGDRWFDEALDHEDAGRLEEAAATYERALTGGTTSAAEATFNLANVRYALGEKPAALERFLQAVELDPEFVEAWNNLGNVLAELGRPDDAIRTFRRALEVEPTYPDAHYNLAECLNQLGKTAESKKHWRSYLKVDPYSSWAEHVRARLKSLD